jgi:uncharacterized protein (TIGR03118 family)
VSRSPTVALAVAAVAAALAAGGARSTAAGGFSIVRLVSDGGVPAASADRVLVNGWGLVAGPTGPFWTTNEASDRSALYTGSGQKQRLTVQVAGGPTGIAYNPGNGFRVSGGGHSASACFPYACADGRIRAWTPTVPTGWSTTAVVAVDATGQAAIFRGVALAAGRLYATDFHNDRVDVFDSSWRRVAMPKGSFADPRIPAWYAPDNIEALGGHLFVTYVYRAPVDGNDAPSGGYVDEFATDGRLVARVASMGPLAEPWGLALAPRSFGRFGGDLLVASFGNGHVDAYRRAGRGWRYDAALSGADGRPLVVNGIWGLAFGNGSDAGPRDRLFFMAGPHLWRGASELEVHGLFGAFAPSA